MPFKSLAQMRLMYGSAKSPKGYKSIPKDTAEKFISDSQGQDTSKLPKFSNLKKKLKVKL